MDAPASEWIRGLDELLQECDAVCLATVLAVKGSAPRAASAKMVVTPDDRIRGSIGGGNLEQEARAHAVQLLKDDAAGEETAVVSERYRLCPQVHQCCGGTVDVLFEVIRAPQPLHLFGAGHVAAEVASVLRGLDYSLTIVDTRAEWNNPERFPSVARVLGDPVEHARKLSRGIAIVMTHDHELDFQLLSALLERPLQYIGLIGSETKRRKAIIRLPKEKTARLISPIGLHIGGKTPREIAVSVAAELIALRNGVLSDSVRTVSRMADAVDQRVPPDSTLS